MKCLLSDARMRVEDIAKETSLSPKTVTRRLEKMRENHKRYLDIKGLRIADLVGYTTNTLQ